MSLLLNHLSLRNRIWAIVALLIGSIVLGGVIDVLMLREALWQEKELKTRQLVESGFSVLAHFHDLQQKGELSEAAAQAAAIGTIKAMRYDEKEYFWLQDLGTPFPRMIMHPTVPALDGKVLDAKEFNRATRLQVGTDGAFAATDGNKNLFVAFVEVVKQGGQGYVTYDWPKAKADGGVTQELYPKLSYVKKFEPWGWLIGSGIYIDDLDNAVRAQAGRTILLVAGLGTVLLLFASAIARSITQPLQLTVTTMRAIGKGEGGLGQRLPVEGRSEIAELAGSFNDMLEHLDGRNAELARHQQHLEEMVAQRTAQLQETNTLLKRELSERHRLSEALRQTDEAIVIGDPELRFVYINPAFTRLFGYTPEEVAQENLAILAPPESSSALSPAEVSLIAATEGKFHGETLRRAKDGRLIPVLMTVAPLWEDHDRITGFVGTMTDLSEVKRAEESLRESEEKFRSASAAAQDAMVILDAEGRVSFWNAAAEKIFGYRSEEILGQPMHPLLAPERYRKAYQAGFANFQATGQGNAIGKTLELEAIRKGGEIFPIEISLSSVKHGDQWLGIGIVRDITERKRVEARSTLFRTLLDQSNDAVEVLEPATLGFVDVNEQACRSLGYSREELLSMRISDIDPSFGGELNQRVEEQIQKSGAALFESIHRRKDGSTFPVEISLRTVDLDKPYALTIVRDITERKRIEREMQAHLEELNRANGELKELNDKLGQAQSQLVQSEKMASIGQLAAGVAHEINNPIGYVYSNIGTLEKYLGEFFTLLAAYERAEPSLDEASAKAVRDLKERMDLAFLKQDVQALLDESHEGINRVKKIVQDLKDFSHVDEVESWKEEDLHQGLESTLNVVWNELKYKCTVEKEYGTLPLVECLLPQLNQVFMNLLVNAAQAIDEQGTLTLRTGTEGDRVWVEVADTGKGIPPENIPRLFDPFFTTKPVGMGTGLGLSVSYSIVQKHHGEITVESTVGVGSAFRIWLPIRQPKT